MFYSLGLSAFLAVPELDLLVAKTPDAQRQRDLLRPQLPV